MLENLTIIPSGDPSTWEWVHSLSKQQRDALRAGTFEFRGEFPQIGVVTRKVGKQPAPGQVIVKRKSGVQGILEEVLTPGTYKIKAQAKFGLDPPWVETPLFAVTPGIELIKSIQVEPGEMPPPP